jgi:glucosamine 6-phosphate synthetase-like amidotransferase/phosphosugar isomerase protein
MCAIFGMGFMNGHKARNNEIVKELISRLLVENLPRGRDASGVALVSANKINVIKKDLTSRELVERDEYKEAINKHVRMNPLKVNDAKEGCSGQLLSVLGHCRFQTKGTYRVNENNHPIVRDDVVGVHNGCISNDDTLFELYKMKRNAEVDSEAIFALIEHFVNLTPPIHEAIMEASSRLMGGFACAMVHKMQPHIIWLFRRSNPCDIVIYKATGVVIWSSEYDYIKKAVKPYEDMLGHAERMELAPNSGIALDLYRNQSHSFDIRNYTTT